MTFNFADLDLAQKAETPFEFELEHPETKEGLGVFISVIGSESETFQRYVREEGNKARRKAFEAQRKGKSDGPMTVEDEEGAILRAVSVCIHSWRTVIDGKSEPVIHWGGDKLDCTPDNAFRWLSKFRWVREQVNKATGELGNFLPTPSKASPDTPATSSN